jgi:hypothetical protein
MLLLFNFPKKRCQTRVIFLSSSVVAGYGFSLFRPLELDG